MAAGDKVQVGRVYKVEFAGAVWAGRTIDSLTNQKTANVTSHLDQRNATVGYMAEDPGEELQLQCRIEDSGSVTPLAPLTIVQITPPGGSATNYIVIAPTPVTHTAGVTTQSATFVRKDAMASVLDA